MSTESSSSPGETSLSALSAACLSPAHRGKPLSPGREGPHAAASVPRKELPICWALVSMAFIATSGFQKST